MKIDTCLIFNILLSFKQITSKKINIIGYNQTKTLLTFIQLNITFSFGDSFVAT